MNEEKESSSSGLGKTRQGKEKEPITRGEREAFKELKRTAKETLGISISGQSVTPSGYLACWIRADGKTSGSRVQRIIMMVHLKKRLLASEEVHHINGNKRDNRIENLQVLSTKEHLKLTSQLKQRSEQKFTFEEVLEIRKSYRPKQGWITGTARRLGVSISTIQNIIYGKTYNYLWPEHLREK